MFITPHQQRALIAFDWILAHVEVCWLYHFLSEGVRLITACDLPQSTRSCALCHGSRQSVGTAPVFFGRRYNLGTTTRRRWASRMPIITIAPWSRPRRPDERWIRERTWKIKIAGNGTEKSVIRRPIQFFFSFYLSQFYFVFLLLYGVSGVYGLCK